MYRHTQTHTDTHAHKIAYPFVHTEKHCLTNFSDMTGTHSRAIFAFFSKQILQSKSKSRGQDFLCTLVAI